MGYVTDMLKGGVNSAKNQIKSYDIGGHIKSGIESAGIQTPEMPTRLKEWKAPKMETGRIKLPAGVDTYIPAAFADKMPRLDIPSEINGVQLPQLPDLSSVSSELDKNLLGIGFDTNKLGIRSVDEILKEPDLTSLKSVQFESPVDLNNMPDLTTSMDEFDIDELTSKFDSLTADVPTSIDEFDLSKYF